MTAAVASPNQAKLLVSARWLVTLPFVYGLLVSQLGHSWEGAACFATALVATVAVLALLGEASGSDLWAWVLMFLVVDGGFVKLFWLELHLHDANFLVGQLGPTEFLSRSDLLTALVWTTWAYLGLCLVVCLFRLRPPSEAPPDDTGVEAVLWKVRNLEWATLATFLVLSLIEHRLGLGVLGLTTRHLPLRIDTVLARGRSNLAPALLVLCVWLEEKSPGGKPWRPILMLGGAGVLDALLTTSRGGLVTFLLPVLILWLVMRRLTWTRVAAAAAAGVGSIVLYPIVTSSRIAIIGRALGTGTTTTRHGLQLSQTLGYLEHFVLRVGGADGIVLAHGASPTIFGFRQAIVFLASPGGNAPYYTANVVHIFIPGDFRAPGLIGGFMLIGSLSAVVLLVIVYATGAGLVWRRLRRWAIAPVALGVFVGWLTTYTSDGTMNGADIAALAISLALVRFAYAHLVVQT